MGVHVCVGGGGQIQIHIKIQIQIQITEHSQFAAAGDGVVQRLPICGLFEPGCCQQQAGPLQGLAITAHLVTGQQEVPE